MADYQIERAAASAVGFYQSFLSAPLAVQEMLTPEAVFTPERDEAAEAASIFAWADDRPLLGERFEEWAMEAMDGLDPADRLEGGVA